ncbi:hypothetical protein JCM8547_009379 [Rhodosporidiobolus lusitaniae]
MPYSATELLFGAYLLLPQGTNVFAYLSGEIHKKLYPDLSASYGIQLVVLMVVYGVEIAVLAAAWTIRAVKSRQFVPYRLFVTPRGTYIVPHYVLAWQLHSTIFLIVLIPYSYYMRQRALEEHMPVYMLAIQLPWLIVWQAAFLALWSLAVALVSPTTTFGKTPRWTSSPAALNTFFPAVITIFTVSITTLSGISQHRFNVMYEGYQAVMAALAEEASAFNPSSASSVIQAQLINVVPTMTTFLARQGPYDRPYRATWSCWFLATIVLSSTYAFIVVRYFRYLAHELSVMSEHSGSRFSSSGSFKSRRQQRKNDPRSALQRAYFDMIVTTVFVLVGTVSYGAISAYLAIVGSEKGHEVVPYQVVVLGGLWLGVICFPANLLALYRAIKFSPHRAAVVGTLITIPSAAPERVLNNRASPRSDSPISPLSREFRIEVKREVKIEVESGTKSAERNEIEMLKVVPTGQGEEKDLEAGEDGESVVKGEC